LPPRCRIGANTNAFPGGFRLWEGRTPSKPAAKSKATPRRAAKRARKTTRK
jgi:hypothetical protein